MSRHYSAKDFFRQTPNMLLGRYFAARGLFASIDFGAMPEGKPNVLFDAWMTLPEDVRRPLEAELRDIHDMCSDKGWLAVLEEARWHLEGPQVQTFIDTMSALQNHQARAMTVFLDHVSFWKGATRLRYVDGMTYWRKRKNLPNRPAAVDANSVALLAERIKTHFRETDGRGKNCVVEVYRWGHRDCFFAFPEDHASRSVEWESGEMRDRPHNPAFELVFVYSQEEGSLELNCRGVGKTDETLQTLFAQAILKLDALPPDPKDKSVYDLAPLMNRDFAFTYAPDSGIESVVVKRLRLSSRARLGDQLIVSADTKRNPTAVYTLAEEIGKALPLKLYSVTQAELAATVRTGVDKKPKTVTIRITHPNSCSLKHDDVGSRLRSMLSASGIEPKTAVVAT